jgi:penicillin-binding protein 1A
MSQFASRRIPSYSYGWSQISYKHYASQSSSNKSWWLKSGFLIFLVIFFFVPLIAWGIRFYSNILSDLPDVNNIEKPFAQTTRITDRNGVVLYKIYDENREYVPISAISPTMQNAIIAVEDQDFRTNPGIDYYGLVRAGIEYVKNPEQRAQGASTITQQLIKNLLLTNDRSVTRKLKEIVLTSQINTVLRKQVQIDNPNLSHEELSRKLKEKVLELYLNYIFLGNNSYGVQAAAQTYFGTDAKKLDVLQSAILAGIPKAPSKYDPYKHKNLVLGELKVTNFPSGDADIVESEPDTTSWSIVQEDSWTTLLQTTMIQKAVDIINQTNFKSYQDTENFLNYLASILTFDIEFEGQTYKIEYSPGRKDISLARMYEQSHISEIDLKKAVIEWFNYQFKRNTSNFKAPHFVERVKAQLIQQYWEEKVNQWWLVVKTTLDLKIQEIAEKSITENMKTIRSYKANNSAMVYVDSVKGDVLAYVWSADFYDEKIDGNVDIVQSLRQPWSTIKPFIYALGFLKLPLTLDTTIYDIPFKVWNNDPQNVDGKFQGAIPLRFALAHSRNIPAIKMYFSVWEDREIKKFLRSLGVESLKSDMDYGYPLSIGSAEMKMIELVNLYSHLSALGKPGILNPILEITASDGSVLYKKTEEKQPQFIPSGVAYLMWKILAEKENMPSSWLANFDFRGIKFANKTGTTNVTLKNKKKLPRDGWTALYTPDRVAIFWAGNTDGAPMAESAYGWRVNAKSRKQFFAGVKKLGDLKDKDITPVEVEKIAISRFSGKMPTSQTPSWQILTTLWYEKNLPGSGQEIATEVQLDALCNGKVWPLTPATDIITSYIVSPQSFMPGKQDQDDIFKYIGAWWASGANQECAERLLLSGQIQWITWDVANLIVTGVSNGDWYIKSAILKPSNGSQVSRNFSLRYSLKSDSSSKVELYLDDVSLWSYQYQKNNITDIKPINFPESAQIGPHTIKIVATNANETTDIQSIQVNLIWSDTKEPYLLKNKISIKKKEDWQYEVMFIFSDLESNVDKWSVTSPWGTVEFQGNVVSFITPALGTVSYEASDTSSNILKWSINLESYYKE